MKKFIALILTVAVFTCLFAVPVMADEEETGVKIEFCVGDDTLIINGDSVQVEKPYVVGDGVTLVPLRVITEAFGAEVEWIEETSEIILTYPDVNIHLQIGNPVAEINDMAETMLTAPELTNGCTMVPLRFISETFGAIVSYDEETEKITVEKTAAEEGSIVEGNITNARIGDSYYGWSMENPKDMQVTTSFDRMYISLYSDDGSHINISIDSSYEYDIEDEFKFMKSPYYYGGAVMVADLDVSDPKRQTLRFSTKFDYRFEETYIIVTDKYVYDVSATLYSENTEVNEDYQRIISTFETSFTGDDIHDFSNVENGMRRYEAEKLNMSFCVPANYVADFYDGANNGFNFYSGDYSDEVSGISVNAYSLSEAGTAQEMANVHYEFNKKTMNENLTQFSENVESKKYGDLDVMEYVMTVNSKKNPVKTADVFFTLGDYTYNFAIHATPSREDFEEYVKSVMESVVAEEIDPMEVGLLFTDDYDFEKTRIVEIGSCKIDLPELYDDNYMSDWGDGMYSFSGTVVSCELTVQEVNSADQYSKIKSYVKDAAEASVIMETVAPVSDVTVGSNKCVKYISKMEFGGQTMIAETYGLVKNSKGYVFSFMFDELSYSQYLRDMAQDIISSITANE